MMLTVFVEETAALQCDFQIFFRHCKKNSDMSGETFFFFFFLALKSTLRPLKSIIFYLGSFGRMRQLAAVRVEGRRDTQPGSVMTRAVPDQVEHLVDPQHVLPPAVHTNHIRACDASYRQKD